MTTQTKVSKSTILICFIAVLFAITNIYSINDLRLTAQNMYEHPYTVTNIARGMRSRLLDMKCFVSINLTTGFENEENTRGLFEEYYEQQYEAIDIIGKQYLGDKEDVAALRKAMDELTAVHEEALQLAGEHDTKGILGFVEKRIYPGCDVVDSCLETVIRSSDMRIYDLLKGAVHTAVISIVMAVWLTVMIIALTIHADKIAQKSIKELKEHEQELQDALVTAQKANSAKKDFLSRISHEIRTPINAIVGMTMIAGAHLEDRNRLEDCLNKIAFSSRHLLSLINDVLDMSKIEAGKLTANHESFRLKQLTESVVSVIGPQAKEQEKIFECDTGEVMQDIFVGDFLRINQILLNLLSNAVKFTPGGGTVRLKIRQLEEQNGRVPLQFIVSDTGIGMDEEFLKRLFLPFEQADAHIAQNYGGTGLGMAITHNLVELLEGSIEVKSRRGSGTTFTVELPLALPESADILPRKAENFRKDCIGKRFLLAEDNALNMEIAAELLKMTGAETDCVANGQEAVEKFEASPAGYYDMIFMDVQMPVLDGYEAARKIRAGSHPDAGAVPIAAMTANTFSEDVDAAYAAGMNGYIPKPVDIKTLHQTITDLLGSNAPDN